MPVQVRPLTPDDDADSRRLGHEAFGFPVNLPAPTPEPPDGPRPTQPGTHPIGAFADDRLVARLTGKEYASYFGGVQVPTWGIGGVTVEAEHRGQGALTELFAATFAEAAEHGMALSSLFPSAPGIYRGFGYELVGGFGRFTISTAMLAAVRPAEAIRLRRAEPREAGVVAELYGRWAAEQNGPLTRTGPCFATPDLSSFDGVTLATDAGGDVVGYALWERGSRFGAGAVIEVSELIGLTADATRALLRFLGSLGSSAPSVTIETSGLDAALLAIPSSPWRPAISHGIAGFSDYMIRVLDLPAAIQDRQVPPGLRGRWRLSVGGERADPIDGSYTIEVADGRASCVRGGGADDASRITPRGLSMLYAGALPMGTLRRAGLVDGGDRRLDADLDAVFGGREVHIRDFF